MFPRERCRSTTDLDINSRTRWTLSKTCQWLQRSGLRESSLEAWDIGMRPYGVIRLQPHDPTRFPPSMSVGSNRKTVAGLICLCDAADLLDVSASIGLSDAMLFTPYTWLGLEVTYQGPDAFLRSPRLQMLYHVGEIVAMLVLKMPQYPYSSKSKAPAAECYFT